MTNNSINNRDKRSRKIIEAKTKDGKYWYKCTYCACPYGNFDESQAGKAINCECGTELRIRANG